MSKLYLWALTLAGCHLIFPFDPVEGLDGAALDARDVGPTDTFHEDRGSKQDAPTSVALPVALGGAGFDYLYAVSTDANGNIYLAGSYFSPASVGGQPLPASAKSNAVVISLEPSGALRWVRTIEGAGANLAYGVAHWGGRVFVTGRFEGPSKIGSVALTGQGGGDVFVAGLDDITGSVIWARTLGGSQLDLGWDIEASNGRVCVAGQGGELKDHMGGTHPSAGSYDAFVAMYGTTGSLTWVRRLGGNKLDRALGVALDASGSCAVAGSFRQSITIGTRTHSAASAGYDDVFVAKLSAANTVLTSIAFGSSQGDSAQDIACSGTDLVITGHYTGVTKGAVILPAPAGNADIFVVKLDKSLAEVWSRTLGSPQVDVSRHVAIDSAGRVVVAGQVQGVLPASAGSYAPVGTGDAVLARFSAAGKFEWITGAGAPGKYAEAWGVVGGGAGSYYWVGRFDGKLKGYPLTSAGGIDGFLIRYDKP